MVIGRRLAGTETPAGGHSVVVLGFNRQGSSRHASVSRLATDYSRFKTHDSRLKTLILIVALVCPTALGRSRQVGPGRAPDSPPRGTALEQLRADIAAVIADPAFARSSWGVQAVSLATGKVLFAYNPEKYFSPASNAKLFTAALALDALGLDYRIETSLYSMRDPDPAGTLDSDLIVYGRGDPDFRASLHSGDWQAALDPLALALVNAGVRRINGDLIGDESYFTGPPFGSGWEWEDFQWYYGAEVSALSFNDNSLELSIKPGPHAGAPARVQTTPSTGLVTLMNRTTTAVAAAKRRISIYRPVGENIIYVSGSVPAGDSGFTGYVAVHNPALLFVTMFREVLFQHGITVSGRVRAVDWKYREVTPLDRSKLKQLGSVYSRPVAEIIRDTLKRSQNLYAQLLLLQVGARLTQNPRTPVQDPLERKAARPVNPAASRPAPEDEPVERTTEQAGLEAMNAFLNSVTAPGSHSLAEGTGLTYRDEVSPESVVNLLLFMSRHRFAEVFRSCLPVASVDGTLQSRMKGTAASANLRAKTGTLANVISLSGYVTSATGEPLVFSILLNGTASGPGLSGREAVDRIAVLLASFAGRS